MRLSHPAAPFQGIPPEDVFFVANDRYVQMGMGLTVLSMQPEMYPDKPLQIYLYIDAQPSARDLLLGALLGRSEQLRAMYPNLKGRIYTEVSPNAWEMLNFYSRNGFTNTDAEEEHLFPLPQVPPQPPMGCQFASVPLGTVHDQQAFLARLNTYRMTPIGLDYLTLQMQQPFFMALGYYRGDQPMAEMLLTGAGPESATLVMLYVRQEYRRRGIARALLGSCAGILRERGTSQMITHIHSRNVPQVGLMRSLGGVRRRIITILPAIEIT